MAIVINGSGTVTGISVGGLPDGIVDAGTLATDSVDSAELIAGAIDAAHLASGVGGKVLQVVTGAAQPSRVTISSTTFADTGLTVDITPSATSSKILVIVSGDSYIVGASWNAYLNIRLMEGVSELSRQWNMYDSGSATFAARLGQTYAMTVLASPSSTSAVTYKIQLALDSTAYSAVGYIPAKNAATHLASQKIVAIEIAG